MLAFVGGILCPWVTDVLLSVVKRKHCLFIVTSNRDVLGVSLVQLASK